MCSTPARRAPSPSAAPAVPQEPSTGRPRPIPPRLYIFIYLYMLLARGPWQGGTTYNKAIQFISPIKRLKNTVFIKFHTRRAHCTMKRKKKLNARKKTRTTRILTASGIHSFKWDTYFIYI
ncbi:unnamed protein product [Ixodes pacificus]